MKHHLTSIILILISIFCSAQGKITTKTANISDFTTKTTKIVMSGNTIFDSYLQKEIKKRWTISTYDFCSYSEFKQDMDDEKYYFLVVLGSQTKREREPGIKMLHLLKGGTNGNYDVGSMLDIVSLPLSSTDDDSWRVLSYLGAYIDIIQNYTKSAMKNFLIGMLGLNNFCTRLSSCKNYLLAYADIDLSQSLTNSVMGLYLNRKTIKADCDTISSFLENEKENTIVSICVFPKSQAKGTYYYKMLIGCNNHALYYYSKEKINDPDDIGFRLKDIKFIDNYRK